MKKINYDLVLSISKFPDIKTYESIPIELKQWIENSPIKQRKYIFILCYRLCALPKDEFLNNHLVEYLILRIIEDEINRTLVEKILKEFHIEQDLNDKVLKSYIKQFYIHSTQDLRAKPELYLNAVLKLIQSTEKSNNLFNYILGIEIIKVMFKMSWLEHERLYKLQRHQEHFIKTYIRPIQYTHRINGIIAPKHETLFFAQRNYFVKQPKLKDKKLMELIMITFTTETVIHLGFLISRNLNFFVFDYDYIFNTEPECIFANC